MLSISKHWKLVFFAAAFLGLLLISFTAGEADSNSGPGSGTSNSFAALTWLAASGNTGAIANSSSGLIRNPDGIVLTISTTGLLPGGAYTVWWVLFNEPEFCSPPGCDLGDLPPNGGNPNADASVLWATGRVVDAHGQGHFSAHLAAGGLATAPGQILFGPALLDARGAAILAVVRSHGAALTGAELNAQLTTFNGGCPPNTCQDVQVTSHLP